MSTISAEQMMEGLKYGDRRMLSKAISAVENGYGSKETLLEYAYRNMKDDPIILGITGVGGAGKSTLIGKLIAAFRARGKTVGVIAVDPTSPYTGGAVLGDRIRMSAHGTDTGVFIRSLGSRGAFGGISQGTKDVLYLYKAYGFDIILVESLGVGQVETEITHFVDVTTVLLVPGYGDAIQMAKAGIQEIADIFVINKSDRPEAEALYSQLIASFGELPEDIAPSIVRTIASENVGIEELIASMEASLERKLPLRGEKQRVRVACEIASGMRAKFDDLLENCVDEMTEVVLRGEMTPFEAANCIQERIYLNGGE